MVNIKRILEFFVIYEETAVNTDSLEMHSNENQRFPTALTFLADSQVFIILIPENSKLPYLRIPGKGVKSLDSPDSQIPRISSLPSQGTLYLYQKGCF